MAAVTIYSDFRAQENILTVSNVSSSICHEVMESDAMTWPASWEICMKISTTWPVYRFSPPDLYADFHPLTCLLRDLYADQEATIRTIHGTIDWFQIRKEVCILSPFLFNLYVEYIMQNAGLDEAQARIKISICTNLQME